MSGGAIRWPVAVALYARAARLTSPGSQYMDAVTTWTRFTCGGLVMVVVWYPTSPLRFGPSWETTQRRKSGSVATPGSPPVHGPPGAVDQLGVTVAPSPVMVDVKEPGR